MICNGWVWSIALRAMGVHACEHVRTFLSCLLRDAGVGFYAMSMWLSWGKCCHHRQEGYGAEASFDMVQGRKLQNDDGGSVVGAAIVRPQQGLV